MVKMMTSRTIKLDEIPNQGKQDHDKSGVGFQVGGQSENLKKSPLKLCPEEKRVENKTITTHNK